MSEGQALSLVAMFLFGFAGIPFFIEQKNRKVFRWAFAWTVFWWTPVCIMVWIQGVLG